MSAPDSTLSIDEQNPWLGLSSFTEETRGFFFGREEEVAELERRVKRKLLTVLFGKSGLGKTSILRAGLVPGLRARGYFPVYLRIDYGGDSPEAAEQIKQAIGHAAATGEWTQTGVAAAGESIWEFLHHRDAALKDTTGSTLVPLLIFDQFEELFTLAQSDEFGRARAARFIEELADLVENRPPKALEAKLETDEQTAERFDFSRSDYRVVIALREDYLAPLESLKKQMPSLSQNRLRLAPMTGSQALQAVLRPGKQLVSEEVAEAIVRFVAGDAELANAEVEPSLLSLICRELNEQRVAQHRAEISLDLLAGSHESILGSFYERSVSDQPASVRRIIEDELLTESGYRENLAEETLQHRFQVAGAAPDALTKLVNRRLLRIEERLDLRRVELTHDVLTAVVKASRDQRHEREAREATERTLAEQRAREQATRKALRRARGIATGCIALAAVALTAAALAIVNVQRARRAEADALQTRTLSEQGRNQAQRLLGFLTDDFVLELETFGRYQVIVNLSQREIDYFRTLPPSLRDAQSTRNGALALVNHGSALNFLGDFDAAAKDASEAITMLEQLQRTSGNRSAAATIVLGRAYGLRGLSPNILGFSKEGRTDSAKGVELLRPLADRPGSSVEARRAFLEVLYRHGYVQGHTGQFEEAVQTQRQVQSLAVHFGTAPLGDVTVKSIYARAGARLAGVLASLGRTEEARRAGEDSIAVADQALGQRPQYGEVLQAKLLDEDVLAAFSYRELAPAESLRFAMQELETARTLSKLEPGNWFYLNTLGAAYNRVTSALWGMGRLREALDYSRAGVATLEQGVTANGALLATLNAVMNDLAYRQAQLGDQSGVSATIAAGTATTAKLMIGLPLGGVERSIGDTLQTYPELILTLERDDFNTARRLAHNVRLHLQALRAPEDGEVNFLLYRFADFEGRANYLLGDFAATEQLERAALAYNSAGTLASREVAQSNTWLAMAMAKEGKRDAATQIIEPIIATYRALEKKNRGDQWLPLEFAGALYAQSLTDEKQRPALLREAAQHVDHLVPTIAALHDTRQWRERIRQAQASVVHSAAAR